MTPGTSKRSAFVQVLIYTAISTGCTTQGRADPVPDDIPVPRRAATTEPETCLGLADRGIWPDLDPRVQIDLPAGLTAAQVSARIDEARQLLVLSIDERPAAGRAPRGPSVARKAYPLGGGAELTVGPHRLRLRPGDRAELAPLLTAERITTGAAKRDRDGDGIPDALDLLIGARKTVANADAYTDQAMGYIALAYPMGDVPRTMGVCTDVVIRAARNAGIDLQKALHDDIRAARAAYPMVKGRGDPNIDQRRVGTLLPYFRHHWEHHAPALDDPADPLRPGDVIFMDTFPGRTGPDHIGILSDRVDDQGLPLVINNWTQGTVTAEMDLLRFVPVLHRFRLPQ